MTLEQRIEKAKGYRAQGYNCAQCVLVAFSDLTGMDDAAALKTAIGLGGGCGCGEICGVLSAMALVRGMQCQGTPADKGPVYAAMRGLRDIFAGKFGAVACRDLKAPGKPATCNDLILEGIAMLHAATAPSAG